MSPGKLTVGTNDPAVAPYFEGGDPFNGRGFEGAMAYAIGDALGFAPSAVTWTVVPRNDSFAPGPKKFDFDIDQIAITGVPCEAGRFLRALLRDPAGGGGRQGLQVRERPGPSPRCPTPGSACGGAPPASMP